MRALFYLSLLLLLISCSEGEKSTSLKISLSDYIDSNLYPNGAILYGHKLDSDVFIAYAIAPEGDSDHTIMIQQGMWDFVVVSWDGIDFSGNVYCDYKKGLELEDREDELAFSLNIEKCYDIMNYLNIVPDLNFPSGLLANIKFASCPYVPNDLGLSTCWGSDSSTFYPYGNIKGVRYRLLSGSTDGTIGTGESFLTSIKCIPVDNSTVVRLPLGGMLENYPLMMPTEIIFYSSDSCEDGSEIMVGGSSSLVLENGVGELSLSQFANSWLYYETDAITLAVGDPVPFDANIVNSSSTIDFTIFTHWDNQSANLKFGIYSDASCSSNNLLLDLSPTTDNLSELIGSFDPGTNIPNEFYGKFSDYDDNGNLVGESHCFLIK